MGLGSTSLEAVYITNKLSKTNDSNTYETGRSDSFDGIIGLVDDLFDEEDIEQVDDEVDSFSGSKLSDKKVWRGEVEELLDFKKAQRWTRCRTRFFMHKCKCGYVRRRPFKCDIRICPECGKERVIKAGEEFFEFYSKDVQIRHGFRLKHIVLSQQVGEGYTLEEGFHNAKKNLKKVKKYLMKYPDTGAVVGFQFGEVKGMAHYHLLYLGPWIDKKKLEEIWGLGHSWIRLVNSRDGVHEVFNYVIRLHDEHGFAPPEFVVEVDRILKGQRVIKTWGIFYNRLGKRPKGDGKIVICPKCGEQMTRMGLFFYSDWTQDVDWNEVCGYIYSPP